MEVHTITERAGQTEEAERSHLSTDFHFGKVNEKDPEITAIWSCAARGVVKCEQPSCRAIRQRPVGVTYFACFVTKITDDETRKTYTENVRKTFIPRFRFPSRENVFRLM